MNTRLPWWYCKTANEQNALGRDDAPLWLKPTMCMLKWFLLCKEKGIVSSKVESPERWGKIKVLKTVASQHLRTYFMYFPPGCMMSYFTVNQYSWRQLQIPTSTSRPISQSALWQLCLIQVLTIYQTQIHPQNTLNLQMSAKLSPYILMFTKQHPCAMIVCHM